MPSVKQTVALDGGSPAAGLSGGADTADVAPMSERSSGSGLSRKPPWLTRGLLHVAAAYGFSAFLVLLGLRVSVGAGRPPPAWLPVAGFLAIAGFPVVLAVFWLRRGSGPADDAIDVRPVDGGGPGAGGPETAPDGRDFLLAAVGIGMLLVGVGLILRAGTIEVAAPPVETALEPAMLVLPLIELDGSGDRYFADGVTAELIAGLAAVDGLTVAARSSATVHRGVNRDAAEAARNLQVPTVLDGTIRRSGTRVRLTVRLLDAASGAVAWSATRDTTLAGLFAVRDEVVDSVARHVGLEIDAAARRRLERRTTTVAAHDLYMLGRFRWAAGERGDLLEAASFFQLAIEADSGFAPAWSALADAYVTLPRLSRFPPARAREDAAAAARTALQLDPDDVEGHLALAQVMYVYGSEVDGARSHLARAAALDPGNAAPAELHCELELSRGNLAAAAALCETARRLDPLAFRAAWLEADLARAAGDLRASTLRLDSLARSFPDYAPLAADLAISRLVARDTTEALSIDLAIWLEILGASDSTGTRLAAGRPPPGQAPSSETRRALTRLEVDLAPSDAELAALRGLYGDEEGALEAARRALAERSPGALRFGVQPEYAILRENDGFRLLLRQAGLLPQVSG